MNSALKYAKKEYLTIKKGCKAPLDINDYNHIQINCIKGEHLIVDEFD